MSATIGAALKKIAVALLADRRNWEKIGALLLAVVLLVLLPVLSVEAIFQGDFDWDSPELVSAVLEDLDVGSLGFLENTNSLLTQLQNALKEAGFGFEEFRKAQALYWLALSPYAEEADFIEKLVGCFAPNQSDEQLIGKVNAVFGTDIGNFTVGHKSNGKALDFTEKRFPHSRSLAGSGVNAPHFFLFGQKPQIVKERSVTVGRQGFKHRCGKRRIAEIVRKRRVCIG